MIPRFIILREGEHWAVGRHVASCDTDWTRGCYTTTRVPIYSLVDEHFELITDATAWVAAQEGAEHE